MEELELAGGDGGCGGLEGDGCGGGAGGGAGDGRSSGGGRQSRWRWWR